MSPMQRVELNASFHGCISAATINITLATSWLHFDIKLYWPHLSCTLNPPLSKREFTIVHAGWPHTVGLHADGLNTALAAYGLAPHRVAESQPCTLAGCTLTQSVSEITAPEHLGGELSAALSAPNIDL